MSNNYPISILIVDYNKPVESELLINSIKNNFLFNYKIIYLDNGNSEDYSEKFLSDGKIDFLIKNKQNLGLGIATKQLVNFAQKNNYKYGFYIQNDQFIARQVLKNEIENLINLLEENDNIKSISLAGDHAGGKRYNDRGQFFAINFRMLLEINTSIGGPGPFWDFPCPEGQIQEIYKYNSYTHYMYPDLFIADNGKASVRQNPDGSIWKHQPDSRKLWLVSGPIKEKFTHPNLTNEEWEKVLSQQYWPDGQIPQNEKKDSFFVNGWH